MNPGDIFLSKTEQGKYEKYKDGSLRVFLCKGPHERVRDAYYVELVRRSITGGILYNDNGEPSISRDAMLVKWPEVIE